MTKQLTQATSETCGGNEPKIEQGSSASKRELYTTSLAVVTAGQATVCDLLQQPSRHLSDAVHDFPVPVPGEITHLAALQDVRI